VKRFSETEKWDDPWFLELPPPAKLLFLYIIDRCNNAGFLELSPSTIKHHTKMEDKAIQGAWKALERGIIVHDGWAWVRRFLRHQKNETLNPENPAHKQIITLLRDQSTRFQGVSQFDDFIAPYKGLLSPIGTGQVKEKVPDKEGVPGEPSPPPRRAEWFPEALRGNGEFIRLFREWEDHKRGQGYPITPTARPHVLGRFAAAGPGVSCAVLERSLADSATKLMWDEPKNGSSKPMNGQKAPKLV